MQPLSIRSMIQEIVNLFGDDVVHYRHLPPESTKYAETERPIRRELKDALEKRGIENLYSHQASCIDVIRDGKHVVVMTPTASGKSLIYNIPVLEAVLEASGVKALYLFPLKGLGQDQIKTLKETAADLDIPNLAQIYDGDTTAYRRRKIRESFPNIVFSNPDMLHYGINAFHGKWGAFLKDLRYVVIDEIHAYRGVFGSHVAHVFRRLRRLCSYYGSRPQFIACSATIANPGDLATELTGLDFEVMDRSGAPRGGRHVVFLNPSESAYTAATKAFRRCVDAGLKSIAFTKARRLTELIYSWLIEYSPRYERCVSSYRAGFLPSERREIERKLFSGELKGVITTSALELGVDIGGLDACILIGYPGSIASTWQRAGRVGRQGQDALIVLIGLNDALDQFFMRHPDNFFGRSHEAVTTDSMNTAILKAHLLCASSEMALKSDETVYDMKRIMPVIREHVRDGTMKAARGNTIWSTSVSLPQRNVSIRGAGRIYRIISDGKRIAEISGYRVLKETHPGAIYLHKGRQYVVEDLDLEDHSIFCRETESSYYTQAISHEDTDIIEEVETGTEVSWGYLRITNSITGYRKKDIFSGETIETVQLDLPSWTFETQGLWLKLDADLEGMVLGEGLDFQGGIHAFEHASISAVPLFAMCEKADIGGISYSVYPDFGLPAVFIYDGCEGGVGLTRRCVAVFAEWMGATERIIDECPCDTGCPSCVQDPQCGSGNEPLDKRAARLILERIRKGPALPGKP